ncbi:MAG: hypothetical protein IPJ81_07855 [Chitinophagaceae bacterium]|nr:hypothetical protein [Chitinophagaceae bacterium]
MLQAAHVLMDISRFATLLPIFFILQKKRNLEIAPIKILCILLFVSVLSDFTFYVLKEKYQIENSGNIVNNIYTLLEFFLLNYMYFLLFKNKKITNILSAIFILFFIIDTLFIEPFDKFQSWPSALEAMIFIIYSIKYYFQLLDNLPRFSIFRFYPFWLNTAVFYYFGACFLIFFCTNYIVKTQSQDFREIFWGFHNINNIIKNILFAIAIYWAGKDVDMIKKYLQ